MILRRSKTWRAVIWELSTEPEEEKQEGYTDLIIISGRGGWRKGRWPKYAN